MTKIRVLEKKDFTRKLVEENSDEFKQLKDTGYKATKKVFANNKTFLLMEIKEKLSIDKNINKVIMKK